jgi:hypothetical protein
VADRHVQRAELADLHPDFLVVSATHGTAHLALFEPAMWEKYQLATLTGGQSNTLVAEQRAAADPKHYEDPEGAFSPHDNPSQRCSDAGNLQRS